MMVRAIIMGVTGCGKSTVGLALADQLGAVYVDGDDLHPQANVDKMARGVPLTDADRGPWLERVGEALHAACVPVLIGCSALKRRYRDTIRFNAGGPVIFVHLSGNYALIEQRMAARNGHFMPVSLLESQFATLEPLQIDEIGFSVDIDQPLEAIVAEAAGRLAAEASWLRTSP